MKTNSLYETGAAIDYRPDEQKDKDFRPEEAFASNPFIDWREKSLKEIEADIKATSISQGYTSRCVTEYAGIFFEVAELKETGQRIVFSRRDIYSRRYNRPQGGMAMFDLFKIMREGTCLETQLPSTAFNEAEINQPYVVTDDMKAARAKYAAGNSFTWSKWDIDDVAGMVEQGIPVCLFWYFDGSSHEEWWNTAPKVVNTSVQPYHEDTSRHQAAAIDYFKDSNGKKFIVVMDSAGQGTGLGKQKNLRFVSEDFFKARCYGAGFAIDKKNLDYTVPPTEVIEYNFTRNLKNGMQGEDVRMLQKILVLEGCLQIKEPTIYYRGMTEAAVKKLQEKYATQILKPLGLKQGTGMFYNSTRAFINKKYSK